MSDAMYARLRWGALRGAFTMMMWAFLFFVPLPVPVLGAVGWLLLLGALGMAGPRLPSARRLCLTVALGLAAVVAGAVAGRRGWEPTALALSVLAWVLLATFVWRAAADLARLAAETGADDVARTALRRRWLPLVPAALVAGSALVPARSELVFGALFLLVTVCVVCLLMGMMGGAARMCAHAAAPADEAPPDVDAGEQAPAGGERG